MNGSKRKHTTPDGHRGAADEDRREELLSSAQLAFKIRRSRTRMAQMADSLADERAALQRMELILDSRETTKEERTLSLLNVIRCA